MIHRICAFMFSIGLFTLAEAQLPALYASFWDDGPVQRSALRRIEKARCQQFGFVATWCSADIRSIEPGKASKSIAVTLTFAGPVPGQTIYPVLSGPRSGRLGINLAFEHRLAHLAAVMVLFVFAIAALLWALFSPRRDPDKPPGYFEVLWYRLHRWDHLGF